MIKPPHFFPCALFVAGILTAASIRLLAQTPLAGTLHPPILPLAPAEVLALLPNAPKDWELKQSRARNTYTDWLHAEATREYSHPAPAQAAGSPARSPAAEPTPAPPWITRVKILDTGYNASATVDFAMFKPGKAEGIESLLVNGLPAHLATLDPGSEQLRVSVRRRFIVQIETLNQPVNASVSWAKAVDFTKLSQTPDLGSEQLPRPISLVTLDELDPKKNRVSKLQWATAAEVEAASKQTLSP